MILKVKILLKKLKSMECISYQGSRGTRVLLIYEVLKTYSHLGNYYKIDSV